MKILIAEDNVHIRNLIARLLESALDEYELIECSDGSQAVKLNQAQRPDLILMDIMMKNLDGLSATKDIHKDYPATKILIVSQLPEEEFKEDAIKAGACDYLNKDQLHQLPSKIKKILK